MTVTDQPTIDLPCVCGCPKWDHKQGRAVCKQCTCQVYDPSPDAEVVKLRAQVAQLEQAVTVITADRDQAVRDANEAANKNARLRLDRDAVRDALDGTRQMAIQANAALRDLLLDALGQEDDDRTPLSGYVAALAGERDKARQQLADAEAALVEANDARRLRDSDHLHQRIGAAALVISREQAGMCLRCRDLDSLVDAAHGCGPLTPVDVIIARRPNPPTTEEAS